MSIRYRIVSFLVKRSGMKRMFTLPKEELLRKVEKYNRKRGFWIPSSKSGRYEDIRIPPSFHCLKMSVSKGCSDKAILFLFGGGMMIGPDAYDRKVAADMGRKSNSDVWFPYYPLCTEYSIADTYAMLFETYHRMLADYAPEAISFLGFSSGGALAIGLGLYNHQQKESLPMPRQIIACSPGNVPQNETEFAEAERLSQNDIMVDAAFLHDMKDIMAHGKAVPDYLISGACGDFTGMPPIHFYYGTNETLYAAAPHFETACRLAGAPYHMHLGKGMCHCYPMFPYFPEGKIAYREIAAFLK
ncbi:MAG: alpha/beta hydrolase [Ethanoligenens sp.]